MESRLALFQQIHEIVFFGKGGYDFETVYHLPIWLRNYIYSEITKHYKAESEAMEKAQSGAQTATPLAKGPAIRKPDFTVGPRK